VNSVLAIFGPTASGKTAVAEAIAAQVPAELVSADSMQVYRGLPILTNQSARPARLVAIWPLAHEASLGEYQELAHAAIDEILAAGRLPIVVGGTGLYFRAALADLELPPAPAPGARERWDAFYNERGGEAAHAELASLDPDAAAAVHPNDRRRIVRALELVDAGTSLRPPHDRLWTEETRHPTLVVGLDVAKETLEQRIAERTEAMFAAGVEEEVQQALAEPLSTTARKVIGLSVVSELPRTEAIAALAQRTRSYAAYQRKWMRRIPGIVMIDANRPADEVADAILTDSIFKMARARQQLRHRGAG
jgi:tRNA dimethylallyltransferase